MKLLPRLVWSAATAPASPLPEGLLPLLEAIARTGSLLHAAAQCGISYRTGWTLLHEAREQLGVPLVVLARGRGHGSSLTPAGRRLVDAATAASRRVARLSPSLAIEIGERAPRLRPVGGERVRIAASHDLALAALRDTAVAAGLELDLRFIGSLTALEEFANGGVDVAGFHVATGARARDDRAPFLHFLSPRRDRLLRFVDREQGLILSRGNPARVRSLRHVATRGLRFVNRQRGSGTRVLIERRLEGEGLSADALQGFANEEFTHAAVAATIASGGADAGFGLRAAAAEYGLAFVPLVRERYFLAVRAADLDKPALVRFRDLLRGPATTKIVGRLPGYRASAAGTVVAVSALNRSEAK
jgi:molybdate transport repressor ModE-like protein